MGLNEKSTIEQCLETPITDTKITLLNKMDQKKTRLGILRKKIN